MILKNVFKDTAAGERVERTDERMVFGVGLGAVEGVWYEEESAVDGAGWRGFQRVGYGGAGSVMSHTQSICHGGMAGFVSRRGVARRGAAWCGVACRG